MRWPWTKTRINITDNGNANAEMLPVGTYEMQWERQNMPDPGAQAYSWETLGLSPRNLVNSGFGQTMNWTFTHRPLYVGNAVPLAGIPRIGGTIAMQPLIRTG